LFFIGMKSWSYLVIKELQIIIFSDQKAHVWFDETVRKRKATENQTWFFERMFGKINLLAIRNLSIKVLN
jgi:hypothetical protein